MSGRARGRHKIFLGYAVGVGKTFEMLEEARRRKARGQDVVVGMVLSHARPGTHAMVEGLEVIPPRQVAYRGTSFPEFDLDAVLARRPYLVLVDELAHSNVPGSLNAKRWQDVEQLLEAGIHVLSTLNVQHLESLNDVVSSILGTRVAETVPDRILHEADEVALVDLTPRALMNRMKRGAIYPDEQAERALAHWCQEGKLSALRQLALRELTRSVEDVLARHQPQEEKPWGTHDRILVCVAPSDSSDRVMRRAWRIARRLEADLFALYVESEPATAAERGLLEETEKLSTALGFPFERRKGDVAAEIVSFAQEKRITQLVIGHSRTGGLKQLMKGSLIAKLAQRLRHVDILIVATDGSDSEESRVVTRSEHA